MKEYELQAGKNFAWTTVAQFALRIFGLGFFVFMSFVLGERGIGEYSFVASFVVLWFVFVDFGIGGYLYREWSKKRPGIDEIKEDFNIVFSIRLFFAISIFVPFVVVNYYINSDVFISSIIFFFSVFIGIFLDLSDIYFRSHNNFKYPAFRQIFEKIISVFFGIFFLLTIPRIEFVFISILLGQISSLLYYIFYALPFKFKLVFNVQKSWFLIKKGIPFLMIGLFTSLYSRIDMTMLKFMGGLESVGFYGVAYKFIDLVSVFAAVLFIPSIFPILSSLYNDYGMTKKFNDFFYKSFRILFSSSFILTLFIIIFSPWLISLFFPESFGVSVKALRILVLAQVLGIAAILFNNLLAIQNKEVLVLRIVGFSAVLNIILNIFLIPRYSFYGAAWATVITEIVNLILLILYSKWVKDWKVLFRVFLLVLSNFSILIILKIFGELNNIFFGIILLVVNLFLLYKLRILRKDDIDLFFKPIQNKISNILNNF